MRLVIVSNRLPLTVIRNEGGDLQYKTSVGGLATGISSYLESAKIDEHIWVGWPGLNNLTSSYKRKVKTDALSRFGSLPVFLAKNATEKFYNGFCNKTLYPLFHYFHSHVIFSEDYWTSYKHANEAFCKAISKIVKPDSDVIWIHDYHLMLLPRLLRKRFPNTPIGFFLHIPFPSFETFRLLPKKWSVEILKGVLGADLIGFHTYDYTQNFLKCTLQILGFEHNMGKIIVNRDPDTQTNRTVVSADAFPMGISFDRFHNDAKNNASVKKHVEFMKKNHPNVKTIFSVDRLDYTKGIVNRLLAYELFLEQNAKWRRRVIFNFVVCPSRTNVSHYQQMKKEIDELVGRINGRFGLIDWIPIWYQYKYIAHSQLVALYSVSDIALITPLRDGMNLVSKEFIASRVDKTGVLILSELAGASKELGEAIIINPNHVQEIADALIEAVEMPIEEQKRRNEIMQKRLRRYDVNHWANDFFDKLQSIKDEQTLFKAKMLDSETSNKLEKDFAEAEQRYIFVDYDGTLVPFSDDPLQAIPGPDISTTIKQLSEIPNTKFVLVSGRDKDTLQKWFGTLNIGIVAEHGAWLKEYPNTGDGKEEPGALNQNWSLIRPLTAEWKTRVRPILETATDRLPGSFVEEKEFSLAWHYRKADPELASLRMNELLGALFDYAANEDLHILQGNKVIELRNSGVNKGIAAMHYLSKNMAGFILAIGDDRTDEDLFRILPKSAYTIKVGMNPSFARFNLADHRQATELLGELAKDSKHLRHRSIAR